MRVLIFGGLGVLGQQLCRLADGHEVTIVDTADPFYPKQYGAGGAYASLVQNGRWDIIYYLAEEANLKYTGARQTANACMANVIHLEECLSAAAITGIPTIVPVWQEFSQLDTIGLTLGMKSEITRMHLKRMSARITLVEMPLLIDCEYPKTKRGSLLSRMEESEEFIHIYDEDFLDKNRGPGLGNRTEFLEQTRHWLSVTFAADTLWKLAYEPNFGTVTMPGVKGNLIEVLHALMVITLRDELIVNFQRYEPICIERIGGDDEVATLRDLFAVSFR